jgi:hypothetical protein
MQPAVLSQESTVQPLPSEQLCAPPLTHLPASQVSPTVHTLASVHGAVLLLYAQPAMKSHKSSVQMLPSSHAETAPMHPPFAHASPLVQALPSSHAALLAVWVQPAAKSHVSSVQGLASSQLCGPPGVHAPFAHVSATVHTLPSEHGALLLLLLQPLASHVSVVHGLPSSHGAGLVAWHTPAWHASPVVQLEPSSHGPVAMVLVQPTAGSHASRVHALASSQFMALPGAQTAALQTSASVQLLPSEHGAPLSKCWQPTLAVQVSSVQAMPSSQLTGTKPPQAPPVHVSPTVQAL